MIEVFIHEEYVNKRREQKKKKQQQQREQPRRRRHMRALQIETGKVKLPPATAAAPGQQWPRDQNQQAALPMPGSPVGSPTADAATFRDHLFDYLKPY